MKHEKHEFRQRFMDYQKWKGALAECASEWNENSCMQLLSIACNTELNKDRTEMMWKKVGEGLMGEVDNRQEIVG